MFLRLKLLRYENPIILLAIALVTIFLIGGIIFGVYKLYFEDHTLPTVGENTYEEVTETTITKDTVKVPDKLEGVKMTAEELETANAAMTDEDAYEGSYAENVVPVKEDLQLDDAAVDPYVDNTNVSEVGSTVIGVYGVKTEKETVKMIQSNIKETPDEEWLGRPLSDKEKEILNNIKADPKNCYPAFNSAGQFENVMNGFDYIFYTEFVMTVLMCGGDFNNYDCGIY